jgi:hypothetical protein
VIEHYRVVDEPPQVIERYRFVEDSNAKRGLFQPWIESYRACRCNCDSC